MPAVAQKQGEKWRVVEAGSGQLVRGQSGTPVDGGGHDSRGAAQSQANAINASQAHKRGK